MFIDSYSIFVRFRERYRCSFVDVLLNVRNIGWILLFLFVCLLGCFYVGYSSFLF